MNEKQARNLLPWTVVMWDNDPKQLGTVRELDINGFFVAWADGQSGWIDYKDAKKISIR